MFFVAAVRRALHALARPRDELPQPCMQKRAHAKHVKMTVGSGSFSVAQKTIYVQKRQLKIKHEVVRTPARQGRG